MLRSLLFGLSVVLVLGVLLGGATFLREMRYQSTPRARAEAYHREVRERFSEFEQCLEELGRLEVYFEAQTDLTGRLRRELDGFEALHPRGVPAPVYPEYLETLWRFNASLPAWEVRGESLRRGSQRCRALAQAHNGRADSLRFLMEAAGLGPPIVGVVDSEWEEPSAPPQPVEGS
jgi:hypothetical protein